MLLGKSAGRRGINRHQGSSNSRQQNLGRIPNLGRLLDFSGGNPQMMTDMVANYSIFTNKICNPCGFHRTGKRSGGSDHIKKKLVNSDLTEINNYSPKRTLDLVLELVKNFHILILKPKFPKFSSPNTIGSHSRSLKNERNRREIVEIYNQDDVKKLEILNTVSDIEFIIQDHLLLRVSHELISYNLFE